MKISTPKDMSLDIDATTINIIGKFEQQLIREPRGESYYFVVITEEYSREILDKVVQTYKSHGWKKVECKTSSENGERPGLTGLQLWI